LVDFQDVFHGTDEVSVPLGRDHPLFLPPRLEVVFFSRARLKAKDRKW
jgi:hypothetical protein